ncbi:hypothetical protein BDV12DRAFT_14508 [Aspergillus spectabilis]
MTFDIDKWVDEIYSNELVYQYRRHAEKVEKACREQLNKANIQHLSSFRVKGKESLRAKLKKTKKDWSQDIITRDVFDIAGVRIAVYLPEHEQRVHEIIQTDCNFDYTERDIKVYPEALSIGDHDSTEPRYTATHWIVKLNQEGLRYPVEIQVMSVLCSSWAQIEHDYEYKKINADISPAELRTLKAFGMNVILSAQFLKELSELRQKRQDEKFENIYDLGSFLIKWWDEKFGQPVKDIGSLDALLRLLYKTKTPSLNSRGQLMAFLTKHVTSRSMEAMKKDFPDMEVRPAVFFMYQIVKIYEQELQPETQRAHRREMSYGLKLQTIMSTILWLSDFFPPTDWEKPLRLGGPDDKQRVERLFWLATAEPRRLIKQPLHFTTSTEDCDAVDSLWDVLESHSSAAVKLAFTISNSGILRNVAAEINLFNRVFMALGRALKNELDSTYQ